MAKKSKAPSGLSITRQYGTFICHWKRGEDYDSQELQMSTNGGMWYDVDIGKKATSWTSPAWDIWQLYPYGGTLTSFSFRVRGKKGSESWSSWTNASYGLGAPYAPSVGSSADSDESTTFSWSVPYADESSANAFTVVEYQHQLTAGSEQPNWNVGSVLSGASESSITVPETPETISNGSHSRWFRIRSRGMAGDSGWVTVRRVFAKPQPAVIRELTATQDGSSINARVVYQTQPSAAYPIDRIDVEYLIITPAADVTVPPGEHSWTAARSFTRTAGSDNVSFPIGSTLENDKAIFVRVNTFHEDNPNYGEPKLLMVGYLSDPKNLAIVDTDSETWRVTLQVTNDSDVEDSFVVIRFKSKDEEFDAAIVPHGQNQVVVQCPPWEDGELSFGARAVVGSYSYTTRSSDNVRIYQVNEKMHSKNSVWEGGNLPIAPRNVTLSATTVSGSIRVGWEWAWSEARAAEISWADHIDAWESTDEPSTYTISNIHASSWNIAGLEIGKTWYVRVRFIGGTSGAETYSPWSPIEQIDLSTAPAIPALTLSQNVITMDDTLTAYWSYITTDGKAQSYAEICEATIENGVITHGDVIAHTETAQHIDIDPKSVGWHAGESKNLCVRVVSGAGKSSRDWSVPVSVSIAEPITAEITDTSLVHEEIIDNPQTFTGEIVTFESEDVAPVARHLKVALEPIQDLHGYDAPWVGGAGKNKLPNTATTSTIQGVTFTVNSDGSIKADGTSTGWTGLAIGTVTLPAGTYKVSSGIINDRYYYRTRINGTTYNTLNRSASTPFTLEEPTEVTVKACAAPNYPINNVTGYPMIIIASESDLTYEPYSNICPISGRTECDTYVSPTTSETDAEVYTTTLGTTVYGGTLDVTTGVLTVDRAYLSLSQSQVTRSNANAYYTTALPNIYYDSSGNTYEIICDRLETKSQNLTNCIFVNVSGRVCINTAEGYDTVADMFAGLGGEINICYKLATPTTTTLTAQQIDLLLGTNNVWSDGGEITLDIADSVIKSDMLKELPLRVTVSGAGNGGTTSLSITRAKDFHLDRPDETEFHGYAGETIALASQTGDDEIFIYDGAFEDGAEYMITAVVKDSVGQTAKDELVFTVGWAHQAVVPDAEVEMLESGVAKITPKVPDGWTMEEGDTCDIYRLSADMPELIVKGAEFGTAYVDPFPAIGEFGGHRLVYRTKDGDYTTEDNQIAWLDIGEDDGDILESESAIIDFNGEQIVLQYGIDVSNTWEKDFKETKYLGGSIQGDWNEGIRRTGSVSAATLNIVDQDTVRSLRRLANYAGICHIRTADGSSYPCNIEVSEDRQSDKYNAVSNFGFNVIRVDTEELDGITYEQWLEDVEEE